MNHVQALPAFPGAQGVGANATGGARVSGHTPTIYHVTNLNDSGTGSFRDAVSASYRIIVFDVAGYIALVPGSAISVHDNVTIAGETAPGGGVAIRGAEVSFSNGNNIICRHVRFRQSSLDPNTGKSAVGMDTADTIIMDHVSIEFGQWDNIDCNSSTNITYQNILDANPIGQQFNAHADSDITWFGNLWSSAHNRNPLAKGNIEYVNNVLYNFQAGFTAHTAGIFSMDIVKNCFVCGPSGSPGTAFFQMGANVSVYGVGNYYDSDKDGALSGGLISVPAGHTLTAPWNPTVTNSLPTLSAVDAYAYVVSTAGALPWNRDQVDSQVISDVTSLGKKGHMWTSESQTGLANGGLGTISTGAAYPDSDGDGMPDFWEGAITNGVSTTSLSSTATATSGYLNIEDYLHFMAAPHAITVKNTVVSIDLKLLTAGFSGQVFTLSGAANGAVVLATDGHTAQFTPTTNVLGLGSFQFSLPYPDGATATFTVSVCISSVAIPPPPPPPTSISWVGNGGANSWDVNNSANAVWKGDRSYFVNGDSCTLADSSSYRTINITGTVSPGAIAINTSQTYTLQGSGLLSGSGRLTKDGSGTAVIANSSANTLTGGITVNGGTLQANQSLGTGALTLSDGSVLGVANGISLSNSMVVSGTGTIFAGSGDFLLSGSGNTLTNSGPATLSIGVYSSNTLTLSNSISGFSGTLALGGSTGTLRFNNTGSANTGSAAALFDLGTSTGTLGNRNGGLTINLGGLQGWSGTTLQGRTSGSGATATTYVLGALNTDTVFDGRIVNGGDANGVSITKVGAGTLTLTGTSTYSGATTVSAGTLVVNGTLGNTAVSVASGARLTGSGTINGSVNVATGGMLALTSGAVSTLTIGNGLTLSGQTLDFDLSGSAVAGNDQIKLTGGALTLSGTITIIPNLLDSSLGAGTYNLITGGSSTVGTPTIDVVLPTTTRQMFAPSAAGGGIQLIVTGSAASLNWAAGQNGAAWDLNSTANWALAPATSPATDKFYNLDAVNFTDSTANGAVTVTATVQPALINVANSSTTYTFSGAGAIVGPGKLKKTGAGTLIFTAPLANSFTGGTTITAGTILLGSYGFSTITDLGTGPVTLSGGTLTMAGHTGSAGPNNGSLLNDINVPAGSTGILNVTQRSGNGSPYGAVFGALTGSGTFNLGVNYIRGGIAGDWSDFAGTINVTTPGSSGDFFLATNYSNNGLPGAAVNLGNNVRMYFSGILSQGDGTTIPIGELSGTSSAILMGGVTGGRECAWVIGALTSDPLRNVTFAGTIQEQNTATITSLFKVGSGIWTLSGNTNLNGRVNIQQGTLALSGSLSSADAIDIQNGATFQLSGGTVTADSLTIEVGATFSGGGTINSTVSNKGTASFNRSGTTALNGDFENNGTMRVTSSTTLVPSGNFTNNGTLTVVSGSILSASGAASFTNNGVIDLLTSAASTLPAGLVNNGVVIDSSALSGVLVSKSGTVVTLTLQGYTQHTYQLQRADSIVTPNWTNTGAGQVPNVNGQPLYFTDNTAIGSQRYYRIVVSP